MEVMPTNGVDTKRRRQSKLCRGIHRIVDDQEAEASSVDMGSACWVSGLWSQCKGLVAEGHRRLLHGCARQLGQASSGGEGYQDRSNAGGNSSADEESRTA